jgi:hypothetical protein
MASRPEPIKDGFISVDSEEDAGSGFRLFFPATTAPALATSVEAVADDRGNAETILVVDDEPVSPQKAPVEETTFVQKPFTRRPC